MSAPSSRILSEIFIHYIEALHIAHPTKLHMILNYFTHFNSIHPNLHFTAETEQNNTIHYLDISMQKLHSIQE
jgi:hypothetical protein